MRREDDVLISVAEAAALLDVDPATVWRYIQAGDLTPARPKKPYVLWQSNVVEFKPHAQKKRGPKPRRTRPTPTD
jgi:hypothetical protein